MRLVPGPARLALISGFIAAVAAVIPASAEERPPCGEFVTVEPGDTLHRIAERCATTVPALLAANPNLSDPNLINAGQQLALPAEEEEEDIESTASAGSAPAGSGRYQVKSGDTLYSIAEELGTSVADILQANPGFDPATMPIGRVLSSPGEEPAGLGLLSGEAVMTVSSAHAAPGQPVSVSAGGFPPDSPVEIAAGPTQTEFDILTTTRSDIRGMVQHSIEVPTSAAVHRELLFIAQTPDGMVRVVSRPIRIAERPQEGGESGDGATFRVTGELVEGAECPALSADDGSVYSLAMPEPEGFQAGDRVEVEGTEAEASLCRQGTTIDVESIRAAPER